MAEIVWEEPRDSRLGADFDVVAAALRERPGHWARVADGLTASRTQASSLALGIRRGKYRAFKPPGEWEARSSQDVVWARWVGPDGQFAGVEDESPIPADA